MVVAVADLVVVDALVQPMRAMLGSLQRQMSCVCSAAPLAVGGGCVLFGVDDNGSRICKARLLPLITPKTSNTTVNSDLMRSDSGAIRFSSRGVLTDASEPDVLA